VFTDDAVICRYRLLLFVRARKFIVITTTTAIIIIVGVGFSRARPWVYLCVCQSVCLSVRAKAPKVLMITWCNLVE